MRPSLDLADLAAFLAVAVAGSLSRAAWQTGRTQSALSKRITALEIELGQRLFVRNGRGVTLTDAGRSLLTPARHLLEDAQRLKSVVAEASADPAGTVHLGLQASISWPVMQWLWQRCCQEAPGIRLSMQESPTRTLVESLQQGRIDLAVLSEWGLEKLEGAVFLFEAELHLILSAQAPDAGNGAITFAEMATRPLILSPMPNGTRARLESEARDAGLSLDVVLEGHSMHLISKMVQAGWGCTVAHAQAVEAEVGEGRLAMRTIVKPSLSQKFYLARSAARTPSSASDRVADWIAAWGAGSRQASLLPTGD